MKMKLHSFKGSQPISQAPEIHRQPSLENNHFKYNNSKPKLNAKQKDQNNEYICGATAQIKSNFQKRENSPITRILVEDWNKTVRPSKILLRNDSDGSYFWSSKRHNSKGRRRVLEIVILMIIRAKREKRRNSTNNTAVDRIKHGSSITPRKRQAVRGRNRSEWKSFRSNFPIGEDRRLRFWEDKVRTLLAE